MFAVECFLYLILSCSVWYCHAIIGGKDASPGEFPFMVSLRNDTALHYCGGALITKKHIVTSAHCMFTDKSVFTRQVKEKLPAENVTVLVNTISTDLSPGTKYAVEKLTPHPNYNIMNLNSLEYDIGVITLKEEVAIIGVEPIKRSNRIPIEGDEGTIIGWGTKDPQLITQLKTSPTLQKLKLNITDKYQCYNDFLKIDKGYEELLENPLKINRSIYCGFKDAYSGACYRDSGSPMIVNGELAGVVTYGFPCAWNISDIYTSVSYYADFINAQISQ